MSLQQTSRSARDVTSEASRAKRVGVELPSRAIFFPTLPRVGSERSEGGPRAGQGWEEKSTRRKSSEFVRRLGGWGGREADGDPDRGRVGNDPRERTTGGAPPGRIPESCDVLVVG